MIESNNPKTITEIAKLCEIDLMNTDRKDVYKKLHVGHLYKFVEWCNERNSESVDELFECSLRFLQKVTYHGYCTHPSKLMIRKMCEKAGIQMPSPNEIKEKPLELTTSRLRSKTKTEETHSSLEESHQDAISIDEQQSDASESESDHPITNLNELSSEESMPEDDVAVYEDDSESEDELSMDAPARVVVRLSGSESDANTESNFKNMKEVIKFALRNLKESASKVMYKKHRYVFKQFLEFFGSSPLSETRSKITEFITSRCKTQNTVSAYRYYLRKLTNVLNTELPPCIETDITSRNKRKNLSLLENGKKRQKITSFNQIPNVSVLFKYIILNVPDNLPKEDIYYFNTYCIDHNIQLNGIKKAFISYKSKIEKPGIVDYLNDVIVNEHITGDISKLLSESSLAETPILKKIGKSLKQSNPLLKLLNYSTTYFKDLAPSSRKSYLAYLEEFKELCKDHHLRDLEEASEKFLSLKEHENESNYKLARAMMKRVRKASQDYEFMDIVDKSQDGVSDLRKSKYDYSEVLQDREAALFQPSRIQEMTPHLSATSPSNSPMHISNICQSVKHRSLNLPDREKFDNEVNQFESYFTSHHYSNRELELALTNYKQDYLRNQEMMLDKILNAYRFEKKQEMLGLPLFSPKSVSPRLNSWTIKKQEKQYDSPEEPISISPVRLSIDENEATESSEYRGENVVHTIFKHVQSEVTGNKQTVRDKLRVLDHFIEFCHEYNVSTIEQLRSSMIEYLSTLQNSESRNRAMLKQICFCADLDWEEIDLQVKNIKTRNVAYPSIIAENSNLSLMNPIPSKARDLHSVEEVNQLFDSSHDGSIGNSNLEEICRTALDLLYVDLECQSRYESCCREFIDFCAQHSIEADIESRIISFLISKSEDNNLFEDVKVIMRKICELSNLDFDELIQQNYLAGKLTEFDDISANSSDSEAPPAFNERGLLKNSIVRSVPKSLKIGDLMSETSLLHGDLDEDNVERAINEFIKE
eukprot:NODE_28_length_38599_cov_0.791792.p2 type:complete len:990 gc:universal NODE_28_length_38599_cov_0.791792:27533-30502(+)